MEGPLILSPINQRNSDFRVCNILSNFHFFQLRLGLNFFFHSNQEKCQLDPVRKCWTRALILLTLYYNNETFVGLWYIPTSHSTLPNYWFTSCERAEYHFSAWSQGFKLDSRQEAMYNTTDYSISPVKALIKFWQKQTAQLHKYSTNWVISPQVTNLNLLKLFPYLHASEKFFYPTNCQANTKSILNTKLTISWSSTFPSFVNFTSPDPDTNL